MTVTIWFSASGHSINQAFATKAEAVAATDWEEQFEYNGQSLSTGNVFSVTFRGIDPIPGSSHRARLFPLDQEVEVYGCMGTATLPLPEGLIDN